MSITITIRSKFFYRRKRSETSNTVIIMLNMCWLFYNIFIILIVYIITLQFLLLELSDIVFAFDSVPAVFGITRDPFIGLYYF